MDNIGLKTEKAERALFYSSIKNNPLTKVSFEFVASVVLVLTLFVVAIKPTIIAIQKVQNNIDELTNFNTSLNTKIDTLNVLVPIFQNNSSLISVLNNNIPDHPEFPLFEKQLRYLLNKNNLEVMALTFSEFPIIKNTETVSDDTNEAKPSTDVLNEQLNKSGATTIISAEDLKGSQKLNYTLTIKGDYNNAKSFLSQLQTLQRIASVESITINSESGQSDALMIGITGAVYYSQLK